MKRLVQPLFAGFLGLFVVSVPGFGAITGLTAFPGSVTFEASTGSKTVQTDSAPIVAASGTGSAGVTVSVSSPTLNVSCNGSTKAWLSAGLHSGTITGGGVVGVTISANPCGLNTNLSGTVTVTSGGTSAVISVTLNFYQGEDATVTAAPAFPLSLAAGTPAQHYTIGFTAAGQPNAAQSNTFQVSAAVNNGTNWLSAAINGDASDFTMTVDTSKLLAGDYSGAVSFSGSSGAPFQVNVDVTLTVAAPAASISGLNPGSATAGGAGFTLAVNGSGFVNGSSVIQWNGSPLTTTFVSATQLTAQVASALIASAGSAIVTVANNGAPVSNTAIFIINSSFPAISVLTPGTATAGGAGFTLTVSGSGFVSGVSTIQWNNSSLPTTFVSASQLTAPVSASLIASAGSASVTVFNSGAGASSAVAFNITATAPVISGLVPSSAVAGGATFTLTVNGSGFVVGSNVQWNGSPLPTAYVSATQLTATVSSTLIVSPASVGIVVLNTGGGASSATTFTVSAISAGALQLVPLSPCRVMDTRNANGTFGGPYIASSLPRAIPVPSSSCGIPSSAMAYSLNFTVVPRNGKLGSLTVWPGGQFQPNVSTLTSPDGSVIADAAIVPAGAGGSIVVATTDDTDLVVDINGYFAPPTAASLQFYPLPPCRVLDTRNPNGTFGGPSLAAAGSRSFPVPSSGCGAPASAAAYSLNITVVPQGPLGYLSAWPTGQQLPFVSTLNSWDGTVIANSAILPTGTGGAVSFFASNPTDVVVDINGYFAAPSTNGFNYFTVTPCRLADTRKAAGTFGGPTMTAVSTRSFPLPQSACGLPAAAQAYSLTFTVVPQGILSYLTTWPTGGTQPFVSTLNAWKAQSVANAALVPAGTGGAVSVFVTNPTDVIIDTAGYFGQ